VDQADDGSLNKEYIYSGGTLLATHDSGTLKYHHSDHLSMRLTTDTNGSVTATSGHFPFGENWYETGGTNKLKFTSYERDAESGNDYAMARFHVNRLARFASPDPIAGSLGNPQSLNRYAYSLNDPINVTDPLGLSPESEDLESAHYLYPMEAGGGVNTWGSSGCVECQFDPQFVADRFVGQMVNWGNQNGYGIFLNGQPQNQNAQVWRMMELARFALGLLDMMLRAFNAHQNFLASRDLAIAGLEENASRAIGERREFIFVIYTDGNGIFGKTPSEWGPPCSPTGKCQSAPPPVHLIPQGMTYFATVHMHPIGGFTIFSTADRTAIYATGMTNPQFYGGYLGGTSGQVMLCTVACAPPGGPPPVEVRPAIGWPRPIWPR
jgi:RHS repeat-associated protein